jgi:sarcosine oxidase subunit beta
MSNTFDVIIIGGGVHGASLAFHLAERGVRPVVLEKRFLAAGATGRSSGLVRMHYDLLVESQLAWVSFGYFRDWQERVGGPSTGLHPERSRRADCGFTKTGFLQLVRPEQTPALRANVAAQRGLGIATEVVSVDEVRRLAPGFFLDDIEAAAYEPESGYADPTPTANSLMNAAKAHGAAFVQNCAVTAVHTAGGKVTGVSTTQGDFSAPIVVNAAGAWAKGICDLASVDLPLNTWRHDTMLVKRPPALRDPHLTVIDFPNLMYFRPDAADLTLIGLEDGNPLGQSADGDADHASPGFVEAAIERICQRIPQMDAAHFHSAHSGYDSITPDQPSTVDISLFSPTRFAEGKEIVGEHPYDNIWT